LGEREALADLFEAEAAPDEAEADPIMRMKGRTVLIYTLTEAVGVRVKAILEDASPGVTVHLSHDHDGNERLKQLARGGDIVVIATQSAKHAATTFIEAHLGEQATLLRPAGKGSASMLREIRRHLAS
jgi:5,10-methylene-tetrahydrofolate dehydrogenase/methenyl tetrahydrofolate cyclohydrolase